MSGLTRNKTEDSRAAIKNRVSELVTKIHKYDPQFSSEDLESALRFTRHTVSKTASWNDKFSDPLLLVEKLVEFEKADRDTILASILYPSVRPVGNNSIDRNRLDKIKNLFGDRVGHLIEDTISLWSLDKLPAGTQSEKDNLRDYELMALLVARSRSAIMIRATQAYLNIEQFDTNVDRQNREYVFNQGKIMADLAYLANFPNIRRAILNQSFRIRDPEGYVATRRHINNVPLNDNGSGVESKKVKLNTQEIDELKENIALFLENNGILFRQDYVLEMRPKDPYSAADKAKRKGQDLSQLGDIYAGRIIINDEFIKEHYTKNSSENLEGDTVGRKRDYAPAWHACGETYGKMSAKFGRRNTEFKHRYEELAIKDPSGKDPTKDDRYDDYYRDVKPSGYRAIQDTFFFIVNDKVVEMEMQFVDEKTHIDNTNGAPSHRLMKTNQFSNRHYIELWELCSKEVAFNAENRQREEALFAAIYTPTNDIVIVEGRKSGCFGVDYIKQHFEMIQQQNPEITTPEDIIGIRIDNPNPFLVGRNGIVPLSPHVELRSGDRILGYQLKSHTFG